jgi:hypothetical protein
MQMIKVDRIKTKQQPDRAAVLYKGWDRKLVVITRT